MARLEQMAKRILAMTEGKFDIRVTAGEIVPPPQVFDAVQNGTIEAAHTLSSFFIGKNSAFAFDSGIPFGLNARQQAGSVLRRRPRAAARGVQQVRHRADPVRQRRRADGRRYRKEIKSVADLKGLKFRIGGIGGTILAKLGVTSAAASRRATSTRRSRKAPSTAAEWIGPLRRREARPAQGREVLLHARLVGGQRAEPRCWST